MNILMLTPELYPYTGGGVAMHAYYVNKFLASESKHKIVLLAACPIGMRHNPNSLDTQLMEFIYLLPFPLQSISYVVNAAKSLITVFMLKYRGKISAIHAHTAFPAIMFPVFMVSVLYRLPFVITAHGSDVRVLRKVRIVKLFQRFLLNRASYVICVSKEIKQILALEYGLEDDKLVIIPNGYDQTLLSKKKTRHFQGRERKIVFVAGLRSDKDPSTLIQAFKRVTNQHAHLKLVIVGDGPLKKSLEAMSKELNIADRVQFYGQVDHEKAMTILAECDIYVLTSINEGLPTSLVEAMALGKPIIATNVGGVPEVIEDGINGLLVPPMSPERVAQAIMQLLNEPQLAKRLAAAATKSIEDYSWINVVKKHEQIYDILTPHR
jgi:glycosyltransferase involved in cell wall biosynthesis